ncbi:MAG: hypothetical protein NTX90_04345, partial [Alphaproteobacteria bacterium]|nr:hypothetical protein [Alphaproteobacteria bacterium]
MRGLPLAADYIAGTLPRLRLDHFLADLGHWMWGFADWALLLADTLLIAYVGTVLGGLVALLLSFPAAATLAPPWIVTIIRRVLELMRTVPTLVLALIFVYAFGLGAFAGIASLEGGGQPIAHRLASLPGPSGRDLLLLPLLLPLALGIGPFCIG